MQSWISHWKKIDAFLQIAGFSRYNHPSLPTPGKGLEGQFSGFLFWIYDEEWLVLHYAGGGGGGALKNASTITKKEKRFNRVVDI